ncbi:pilus assembly protein PilX [Geobacter hydrogenophilus]|uniref:Type IV pilus minor pilin PilX n=1 Tax=Geobacter hydrogenophilus TaxID=40983 RepID=A0A9W6LA77_9BACT|nr:pilus assembly protein PilX [Geobacter hydrogenophilus]MBT0894966.1 pilus assembly protein PilX [Geobacter hydrogenophilus]GLI37063.1 type IV pilus minor pilin PilX [Geobacter hydrogenophilus]
MGHINNERGVALVTALMLTLISLAIAMSLLYMVLSGTKMSAAQKRYKSSLEASHGAVELFTRQVIDRAFQGYSSAAIENDFAAVDLKMVNSACFQDKIGKPTSQWSSGCSSTVEPADAPDMTAKLSGTDTNFTVYGKIVDTVPGNSDLSGIQLDSGAGVAGTGSGISPQHLPGLYTLEVQAESQANAREKARLSVLYEY